MRRLSNGLINGGEGSLLSGPLLQPAHRRGQHRSLLAIGLPSTAVVQECASGATGCTWQESAVAKRAPPQKELLSLARSVTSHVPSRAQDAGRTTCRRVKVGSGKVVSRTLSIHEKHSQEEWAVHKKGESKPAPVHQRLTLEQHRPSK